MSVRDQSEVPEHEHHVHRRVPAVPSQVGALRRAVMAAADGHGIADPLRADIALALTEACANVVNHAYRHSPEPGPMLVETYVREGEFVIVVSDEGSGMTPRTDSPGLGLGLGLIGRLTKRMEVGANRPVGARLVMAFAIAG
jgi:serine/threonine-protein kinase RsbW